MSYNHNNRAPNSYVSLNQIDYSYIMEARRNNHFVSPVNISKAISREVKLNRNYQHGEELFAIMESLISERLEKLNWQFQESDIFAFQKVTSLLVRYAPSPGKARNFATLILEKYEKPLRTALLEITLLTNLIFVLSMNHQPENMKDALEIIETALDMGILHVDKEQRFFQADSRNFGDPVEVFETVSSKVLRYLRLELNSDRTGVQPSTSTRQFSH